MRIHAFIKLLIRKINSLEQKANNDYIDNPFYRPYANTFVWVEDDKGERIN